MKFLSALLLISFPVGVFFAAPKIGPLLEQAWISYSSLPEKELAVAAGACALSLIVSYLAFFQGRTYWITEERRIWKWDPSEFWLLLFCMFSPLSLTLVTLLYKYGAYVTVFAATLATYSMFAIVDRFLVYQAVNKMFFDKTYSEELNSREKTIQARLNFELQKRKLN